MKLRAMTRRVLSAALLASLSSAAVYAQAPALPECSSGVANGPVRVKVNLDDHYSHAEVVILQGAKLVSMNKLSDRTHAPMFKLFFTINSDGFINYSVATFYSATLYAGHMETEPGDKFIKVWNTTTELAGKSYTQIATNREDNSLVPTHPTETRVSAVPLKAMIEGMEKGETMTVTVRSDSDPDTYYVAEIPLGPLWPAVKFAHDLRPKLVEAKEAGKCKPS